MDWQTWYDALAKPSWTPSPATIGTVWTVLYPIIAVTFGYACVQVAQGRMPRRVLLPIALNVATNLAFTPIQFGLRDLRLALADILVVLVTIVWTMAETWPYSRLVTLGLSPYLVWVCTASAAQTGITLMNRSAG